MICIFVDKEGMLRSVEVEEAIEAWHPIMVHWITSIKGNNRGRQSLSAYKLYCFHFIDQII